ncbi:hypothetical protein [uncultured Mediterranean phage]|nr:hypothetical protein [uncultured Mediterranean phage]
MSRRTKISLKIFLIVLSLLLLSTLYQGCVREGNLMAVKSRSNAMKAVHTKAADKRDNLERSQLNSILAPHDIKCGVVGAAPGSPDYGELCDDVQRVMNRASVAASEANKKRGKARGMQETINKLPASLRGNPYFKAIGMKATKLEQEAANAITESASTKNRMITHIQTINSGEKKFLEDAKKISKEEADLATANNEVAEKRKTMGKMAAEASKLIM